jgi:hypothetical protein
VETVRGHGWASKLNGDLLGAAAGEFDVFGTVDRTLVHQQTMQRVRIPVVVPVARSNSPWRLATSRAERIGVLELISTGEVVYVPARRDDAGGNKS